MEKFDYIVPLETLRKNRIKSYKEYCEAQKREKEIKNQVQLIKMCIVCLLSCLFTALVIFTNI